jgi:alkylhydroperoxidase family enzyme
MAGETRSAASDLATLGDIVGSPRIDAHLRPFFETWLDTFIYNGRIDPKLRELAILRVMWRCNQPFEWGNHYRQARRAGVSREDIVAIRTATPEDDLEGPVALVVRAADEVVDGGALSVRTLDELRKLIRQPATLNEFLYLIAGYRMFATVAASKHEPYRGNREPWPPDGIAPTDPAP